jgi:cell division protease FtsH
MRTDDTRLHSGFALARAWASQHNRPSIAEALAQCDDTPPLPLGMEEEADMACLHGQQGIKAPVSGLRPGLPMELLLILSLGKAIDAAGGEKLGAPCRISRIEGATPGVIIALEALFGQRFIAEGLLDPHFNSTDLHNCLPTTDSNPRGREDKLRSMFRKVTSQLVKGHGAILVGLGSDPLPDELQPLCTEPLHLPPTDRAMMLALLALRYPKTAEPLLSAALPPEDSIAALSPIVLATALHAPTRAAAIAALHGFCAGPTDTAATQDSVRGLDVVAGQPEAVAQLRQMAADIRQWRKGELDWRAVPRSLLFYGPPGTGKTLLASAFATEAGLPLIATSFSECQKHGHLGDMLAALDTAVSEAARRAPAVFFIDELDGFNSRETKDIGRGGNGYMRAVITGLLAQIDRLIAIPGVVLIGATNALDVIDPAIRRAGRFDTTLLIPPPDKQGMAQILRHHLGTSHDPDLDAVITLAAARLVGTNGAESAALARSALARARGTGEALASALRTELDRRLPGRSENYDRRIALHEAGHTVVGLLSGLPAPHSLRIDRDRGAVFWPVTSNHTHDSALAEIRTFMGGRAAEEVLLGNVSSGAGLGPESDLAHATRLAVMLETEWSLGDGGLIWHPATPLNLRAGQPWLPSKLHHILDTAYAEACTIIATHRDLVVELGEALLAERELAGAKLNKQLERIKSVGQWEVEETDENETGPNSRIMHLMLD